MSSIVETLKKAIFSLLGIKEKRKEPFKIPKSVQDSMPYKGFYENGILQLDDYTYSKIYRVADLNFLIEDTEKQKDIVKRYMEFLGSFGPDVTLQVVIYNKTVSRAEFEQQILLPLRNDSFNEYREELNDNLITKMSEARNNIMHNKYVIATIAADDIEAAKNSFIRIDADVAKSGQRLTGTEFKPLTGREWLDVLNSIYNLDSNTPLYQKLKMRDGRISESFSFRNIRKMGLRTKDVIGPSGMIFEANYFQLGNVYGRSMFLCNFPSIIRGDILTELTNMPFNMLTSVHYRSLAQEEALRLIKNKTTDINANAIEAQKRASKRGYSSDLISPEIKASQKQVESLMEDLTQDNQKLFMTTICITVFAESMELLDKYTKIVQTTAERFICSAKTLTGQQELGLNTSLPVGKNFLKVERMFNTAAAAIFLPFSVKELLQKDGIYYGQNAVSKQVIMYNRLSAKAGNGVILGTTGAGKSFAAKMEMLQVLLNTTDEIFVIDAEDEYTTLAQMLKGAVIRLAPGSGIYLNPLDMDLDYADSDDPITLKSSFISSICEAAASSKYPLSPIMRSVIDRCVKNVYLGYVEELRRQGKSHDDTIVPTLKDFYEELLRQDEMEAHNLALALERFVNGTQDCFSQKTNININNRFTVYNIKDLGAGMMNIGLQVCLDNIWNRMIENSRKGKRTWIFADEFHLLVQTETSAQYTRQIWKRARKWNGIPTGMTQQAEDVLKTQEGRAVINNCDFVMMLNLDPYTRMQMQQMYSISRTEIEYVDGVGPGQGLIYNGTDIIPFINDFPKDTKLYRAMTTKPDDKAV